MRTFLSSTIPFLPLITFGQFTVYNEANSDLSADFISDVEASATGVWVGTANGLNHFDGTDWVTWNTSNSTLVHNIITDLAVDGAGDLWIWNYDQGCSRFDGSSFQHFTTADGLNSNSGTSVMYAGDALWAGNYGGLNRYEGGAWVSYTTGPNGPPDADVRECDADALGGLWVPTFGGGIAYFNGSWTVYNSTNSALPFDDVFVARVHPNGHVWIGTRNGLVDFDNGTFTVFTDLNSMLTDDDIRGIDIGSGGEVLVATRTGGLHIIAPDGAWTTYTTSNSNLPSNEVWRAVMDPAGTLWVATTLGLARFDDFSTTIAVSTPASMHATVNAYAGILSVTVETEAQVRVFDATGRAVWSSDAWSQRVRQDLSTQATGVFTVVIEGRNGQRAAHKVFLP